jgi:hypothetical protein
VLHPRTVELSAISEVVEGHVTIYLRQEEALEGVRKRYPTRQYIQLDEKLGSPSAVKKPMSSNGSDAGPKRSSVRNSADGVTLMFPRHGKLARNPAVFAAKPTPDVKVERVRDLLEFELPAMARHQSTMNRNPNLTRNEVTP